MSSYFNEKNKKIFVEKFQVYFLNFPANAITYNYIVIFCTYDSDQRYNSTGTGTIVVIVFGIVFDIVYVSLKEVKRNRVDKCSGIVMV